MIIPHLSRWRAWRKDELCTFKVTGIWGSGARNTYQVTDYDMEIEGTTETITISREAMLAKIERKEMVLV